MVLIEPWSVFSVSLSLTSIAEWLSQNNFGFKDSSLIPGDSQNNFGDSLLRVEQMPNTVKPLLNNCPLILSSFAVSSALVSQ